MIAFDPRGVGLSDRVPDDMLPSLEVRMADALAVMTAVGSERAAVFGWDATGPLVILFAATYPDRTLALYLFNTGATSSPRVGYPYGWEEAEWSAWMDDIEQRWGSQPTLTIISGSWLHRWRPTDAAEDLGDVRRGAVVRSPRLRWRSLGWNGKPTFVMSSQPSRFQHW